MLATEPQPVRKYIDARFYVDPPPRRAPLKPDEDFALYNTLFDEFLHLAGHFRLKKFIPESRVLQNGTVQWKVPAHNGVFVSVEPDVTDTPELTAMKETTAFYRDKWLELDAKMNELGACRYVQAMSKRTQAVVSGPVPGGREGERFGHNLTLCPVIGGESIPYSFWNMNMERVETRLMVTDGQGLVADELELFVDPRTAVAYKRRLMAMVLQE